MVRSYPLGLVGAISAPPAIRAASGTPEAGHARCFAAGMNTSARVFATRQPVQPEMNPGDEAVEGTPGSGEDVCPICRGTGRLGTQPCDNCGGTGKVVEGVGGA
jgi:RecJ-like exonuclease